MASKKTKKRALRQHKVLVLIGVGLIVVLMILFSIFYIYPKIHNQQRLDRINAIFTSLHLSNDFLPQSSNVFGDKRIYSWDKGRSYSSSETFVRGANVDTTVAELQKDIAKTDFTLYQNPYPGSKIWEYIYKSPKNEYLRITVSSKPRDDAFFNDEQMINKLSTATTQLDANAGPSNVTIKVNLDDNNE